ncbi:MAG TPA: RNA-binding cell elongation regulator Jag/EloR [Gaiellaceae bacterium]|nr:RNA-binding cell elongation regulator Jag/EloR [Gaiellaceae bacterium]
MTEVVVEASGETVGEAKWAALRELERLHPGIDRAAVRFEVVSEGERGLLGVGYTPARVLAAVDAPEPEPRVVDTEPVSAGAALARDFVERTLSALGAACSVAVEERGDTVVATLSGPDVGLVIGRHGQTIDALQYLANAVAHRRGGEQRVVIDAAGYRSRREAALRALAHRAAERASGSGRPVALDPMTAVERKVVHEFLKDDPEVETTSEGTEPNRYVLVLPRRAV